MSYKRGTGRRRKAKTDSNQKQIIAGLRLLGFSVKDCSSFGKGFPDLIVGIFDTNYLIEVKTKTGKLTADQISFIKNWNGEVIILREIEDILEVLKRDHGILESNFN